MYWNVMGCSLLELSEKPSVSYFVLYMDKGQKMVCRHCCRITSSVHGFTRQQTIAIKVMSNEPKLLTPL
jgi:hypothetical protein